MYNCSARDTEGDLRSIPLDWLCDGENDCGDIGAEDETGCSSSKAFNYTTFRCLRSDDFRHPSCVLFASAYDFRVSH